MPARLILLVTAGSLGVACWLLVTVYSLEDARTALRRVAQNHWIEGQRVALRQAEVGWISAEAWIAARIGAAVIVAAIGWLFFGIPVLGGLGALATYHAGGLLLELRRRRAEQARQSALLDAIRFGAHIMGRAGNALQMVQSLSSGGPALSRPIFAAVLAGTQQSAEGDSLAASAERVRATVADALFDDFVLALELHAQHGGRLVPALDALVVDWDETLRLQREAKAMRAGVEASVLLLSLLPFGFLVLLQLLAPGLLRPFGSVGGEALLAAAVAWMVLGYRVLQAMAAPPHQDRVALRAVV
jgi:Flp pilus assembly protein TadB